MKPSEFLDAARRYSQGNHEADWRSAISRAYYGVFHYFSELFASHGLKLGASGQAHFNLYAGLLHCGFAPVGPIASRIDDLRRRRVTADYNLSALVDQATAAALVQEAHLIIADFQTILQTTPAAQIVAGARKHLQMIGKIVP